MVGVDGYCEEKGTGRTLVRWVPPPICYEPRLDVAASLTTGVVFTPGSSCNWSAVNKNVVKTEGRLVLGETGLIRSAKTGIDFPEAGKHNHSRP
jgi:hypothetical protein